MKKKFRRVNEKLFTRKQANRLFIMFLIVSLAVVWIMPFLIMVFASLKTKAEVILAEEPIYFPPRNLEFENYKEALDALEIGKSLLNSILITVFSNLSIIFFSSLAAWQLLRMKKWYSRIIFFTLLITMIVPFQAIMIPLISNMRNFNLTNMFGLVVMYSGFGIAQSTFMMYGFLRAIPTSLEEVAKIEGYNPIRVYFKIILPLLKPIIITIILLNTMWIWNDFLLPSLVYLENDSVLTLPVALNRNLVSDFNVQINYLMAGLTILIIPAIVFFILMQRRIIGGVTRGAIK